LLYQSTAQQADLLVLGAQGASAFAAVTRHGVVYKVLAHAHCPVMTLSPVVLAECGAKPEKAQHAEALWLGYFKRPYRTLNPATMTGGPVSRKVHPLFAFLARQPPSSNQKSPWPQGF